MWALDNSILAFFFMLGKLMFDKVDLTTIIRVFAVAWQLVQDFFCNKGSGFAKCCSANWTLFQPGMADITDHVTILALVYRSGIWYFDAYWTLQKVSEFFNINEISIDIKVCHYKNRTLGRYPTILLSLGFEVLNYTDNLRTKAVLDQFN
jgi:hypothetical protein